MQRIFGHSSRTDRGPNGHSATGNNTNGDPRTDRFITTGNKAARPNCNVRPGSDDRDSNPDDRATNSTTHRSDDPDAYSNPAANLDTGANRFCQNSVSGQNSIVPH